MKLVITMVLSTILTCESTLADSRYLYTKDPIAVRSRGHLRAKAFTTIKPGERFEIIKWNKYNSLVKLSNGKYGFIDRTAVEHLAPSDSSNGYTKGNLEIFTTDDTSKDVFTSAKYQDRPTGGSTFRRGDPELVSSRSENEYIQNYDDNGQETGYLDRKDAAKLDKLGLIAWREATRKRKVARFMGGGYRSGNRSKGMCASAVKDALLNAGLCTRRPDGDAYSSHRSGEIKRSCPGLKLSGGKNPWSAIGGSVIVYSGYAGKRPHNFGHIEIKIPVTPDLLRKMGRSARGIKVGQFLYCSDFCRTRPTKVATNKVQAIYTLN